jgi:tRNA pseudouridine55 synthase
VTKSGILLIDKPEGPSSAEVVHRVKRTLGAKKAGHLGTLDPFASGLLLVGINEGTKIAEIFLGAAKSYCGVMVLGIATDSQDRTGNVLETRPVPVIGEQDLTDLAKRFTGELQQVPPMFSALKKDGVRLYQLARQGMEVPRESRSIRIETLRLRQISAAEIAFDVTCSRGTYVRTLAADIGQHLGCGAHLKSLRRTSCGHLAITEALALEDLERRDTAANVPLISLSAALSHIRAITWENSWLSRLRLGQQEILRQIGKPMAGERLIRIQDHRGEVVALVEWSEEISQGNWRIYRGFHAQ